MPGQVYAVASGKGGVGKTTTVVNLGVALRARDHTVALVDADLGMANLAAHLGIDHEPTLHDVLAGSASVDEAIVEEAEGFVVLPGSRELAGFAAADPSDLGAVLGTLAERYDYVLVDTGAGLSYEDVLPLGLVDGIVLVTSPDPAAVGDAAKTAELGDMVDASIRGVVVTYADEAAGRRVADELGVELLATVPRDDAVSESTAAGTPLEAHAPESAPATAYRDLAGVLVGDGAEDDAAPGAEADDGEEETDEGATIADGSDLEADDAPAGDGGAGRAGIDDEPDRSATDEVDDGTGEDASDDEVADDETEPDGTDADEDETDDETEPDEDETEPDEDETDDAGSGGLFSRVTGLFR